MVWFYLWGIALIAVIIYGIYDGYDIGEKIFNISLLGNLVSLLALLLVLIMNIVCYVPSEEGYVLENTQEIYTLKDNSYLSGYGFISVRIEEEDKYTYMVINDDGTYSKENIESNNVRIKEVDDVTPVLEKYVCESKNRFWSIESKTRYYFVVPKGTVVNTFNVDLE